MAILNPTLACADPLRLADDLDALARGGAGMLHVDVMDGHYVPNLCLNFDQAAAIKKYCPNLPMDVHLMVSEPFAWLEKLRALRGMCRAAGVSPLLQVDGGIDLASGTAAACVQAGADVLVAGSAVFGAADAAAAVAGLLAL